MGKPILRIMGIMLGWRIFSASQEDEFHKPRGYHAKSTKSTGKLRMRRNCAPELGLVTERETAEKFAQYAQSFCNVSSPWALENLQVREVIGFIAPWHKYGYRAAKHLHHKMSSIAPLWLRVLPQKGASPDKNETFEVAGLDFVREQQVWAERISKRGCQVLFHVSLEGFESLKALKAVMDTPEPLAEKVCEICNSNAGCSGIVLDVRLALFTGVKPLLTPLLAGFSRRLRAAGKRFLISVPAEPQAEHWNAPEFDAGDALAIAPLVDAVIVGTRDYSRKDRGPSAPLPWVRSSIKRLLITESEGSDGFRPDQLLIEIPLYGRAFKDTEEDGHLIITPQLVKAMAQHKPNFVWDSEAAEHSVTMTGGKVQMSVPTLVFVRERLRLANSLGVGVALRELGAGFDLAFDLLTVRSGSQDSPARPEAKRTDL